MGVKYWKKWDRHSQDTVTAWCFGFNRRLNSSPPLVLRLMITAALLWSCCFFVAMLNWGSKDCEALWDKSVILGFINKLDARKREEKQAEVKCTDGETGGVGHKWQAAAAAEGRQREGSREKGKAGGGTKVKEVEEGTRGRRDEEKSLKHEGVEGWQERGGRGDGWDGRKKRKPEDRGSARRTDGGILISDTMRRYVS